MGDGLWKVMKAMYRQLLLQAQGERAEADHDVRDPGELRARLQALYGHVHAPPRGRHGRLAVDLVLQLQYDLALTALCRLAGITVDFTQFDLPPVARQQLEEALAQAGLVIASDGAGPRP